MGTKSPQTRNTKPPLLDITYRPTEALRADPRVARISAQGLGRPIGDIEGRWFGVPGLG